MKQKKVLVLGATGAMGQYLVPLLAEQGYQVDACALDVLEFHHPNVRACSSETPWSGSFSRNC